MHLIKILTYFCNESGHELHHLGIFSELPNQHDYLFDWDLVTAILPKHLVYQSGFARFQRTAEKQEHVSHQKRQTTTKTMEKPTCNDCPIHSKH